MKKFFLNRIFESEEKIYCFYLSFTLLFYPKLFIVPGSEGTIYGFTGFLFISLLTFVFFDFSKNLIYVWALWLGLAYFYNQGQISSENSFGSHDRLFPSWVLLFCAIKLFYVKEKMIFPKQGFPLLMLSSVFFSAGISKLTASGLAWASTNNLQGILTFRHIVTGNALPLALTRWPSFIFFAGASLLVFQFLSPAICWFFPTLFSIFSILFLFCDFLILDIRIFLACMLPNILSYAHMVIARKLMAAKYP